MARSLETVKAITARIEEGKKKLELRERIAALLLRNERFLKELEGPILFTHDDYGRPLASPTRGFWKHGGIWQEFCVRWRINCHWDKNKATLKDFILTDPAILSCSRDAGQIDDSQAFTMATDWQDHLSAMGNVLLIRIFPWTDTADLKKVWSRARRMKTKTLGRDLRTWREFERNLCWYDLNRNERQSPTDIANNWKRWGGTSACSSATVSKAIQRMAVLIKSMTPGDYSRYKHYWQSPEFRQK